MSGITGYGLQAARHDTRLVDPLTAAVVEGIRNLALLFAWQVLWPAAVIRVAAALAPWRLCTGVIATIGACAATGIVPQQPGMAR